ncbi:MAG: hypothetical protein C0484_05925 [Rhodospirillum sp.]|nr:hypothetical protein [Rhodospirillum sp.]
MAISGIILREDWFSIALRLVWVAFLASSGTSASADFDQGVTAFQQGDYQTALREFQPLAEAGDPRAEYAIARIYRDALGVKRDKAAASNWMRRAAEGGWPYAMFDLGEMYATGYLGPSDHDEAMKWFTLAAEQGTPQFQLTLGMMYYRGVEYLGVPENGPEAARWVQRAADQKFGPAAYVLGVMLEEGRVVPRDMPAALTWYRMAAEQEIAEAEASLGDLLYRGKDVQQNCNEAVQWLAAAANRDLPFAQFLLATIFERGDCVERDFVQSYLWYSNAWFHGCGDVRQAALDRRNALEPQMPKADYDAADRKWRAWQATGIMTFLPNRDTRFAIPYIPSEIDWIRPHCGWPDLVAK